MRIIKILSFVFFPAVLLAQRPVILSAPSTAKVGQNFTVQVRNNFKGMGGVQWKLRVPPALTVGTPKIPSQVSNVASVWYSPVTGISLIVSRTQLIEIPTGPIANYVFRSDTEGSLTFRIFEIVAGDLNTQKIVTDVNFSARTVKIVK